MCLSKKSLMIVSSQRELFSISPSKRVLPPKESSSFITKSQCFELFSKRVFFFISKSQCREFLPKRIISLLKLSMPSTPSIENFFFSNSQWSCTLGESTKSQRIFMQCILLKTFKIFNFDFLSIAMCMPCKVTWNATLKWN